MKWATRVGSIVLALGALVFTRNLLSEKNALLEKAKSELIRALQTSDSLTNMVKHIEDQARTIAVKASSLRPPFPPPVKIIPVNDREESIVLRAVFDSVAASGELFKQAYETEKEAHAVTKLALYTLKNPVKEIVEVIEDTQKKSLVLHILPNVGIGGFVGVSSEGKPVVGVGLTIGWRL